MDTCECTGTGCGSLYPQESNRPLRNVRAIGFFTVEDIWENPFRITESDCISTYYVVSQSR